MTAHSDFLRRQEAELPRLPVPTLEQTMSRFLRSAAPFLNDLEKVTTTALVAEFSRPGGLGEKLQRLLEARALRYQNWLSEWWLNVAYLDVRSPLPVHSNTGMAFLAPHRPQLIEAAAYVAAVLDFRTRLLRNELPLEKMGPHALDMSQYHKFFGSCRVPGNGRDRQRMPALNPEAHIVVAHNNHFFCVPVYDASGHVLSQRQILKQLSHVVAQSPHPSPTPLGVLTTENRDTWSTNYKALREAGVQNQDSLDVIERSLFALCLDAWGSEQLTEQRAEAMTDTGLRMLHGGDAATNRWFDKTVQFIVGAGGEKGLSFEHSFGDPVEYLTDYIDDFCSRQNDQMDSPSQFERPRRLNFNVPSSVRDAIENAKQNVEKLIASVELCCFTFKQYGKDFMKLHKLGPDSYIQAAIQLAFYRLHKQPGAQYESATTRRFLHGRTETIRSCSLESVAFARTMLDPAATTRDKMAALRATVMIHREIALQALSGQGIDRHLLGLRLAATELGMDLPQLFLDAGYTRSGNMRLSTSQVATRCRSYAFFAPLVLDGYGCCYNPRATEIVFGTSAFNSCPDTSAAEFCRALTRSLEEMKDVLEKNEAKL